LSPRAPPSSPTRRSSDLVGNQRAALVQAAAGHADERPQAGIRLGIGLALLLPDLPFTLGPAGTAIGQVLPEQAHAEAGRAGAVRDRKSTRLNSSHVKSSY